MRGAKGRDRPKKKGWKDGVKEALNHLGLDIHLGEQHGRYSER